MNIRSRYIRRYGLCRTAYEPLAFMVERFELSWGAAPQLQCSLTLPSSITHSAHMLVLARHFAIHVATVSSLTTLISRLFLLWCTLKDSNLRTHREQVYSLPQLTSLPNVQFEQADRFSDYICLFVSCADFGSTQATLIADAQLRKL